MYISFELAEGLRRFNFISRTLLLISHDVTGWVLPPASHAQNRSRSCGKCPVTTSKRKSNQMDLPKIIVPEPVVENSSKSPAPGDKLSLLSPRVTSGCLFVQGIIIQIKLFTLSQLLHVLDYICLLVMNLKNPSPKIPVMLDIIVFLPLNTRPSGQPPFRLGTTNVSGIKLLICMSFTFLFLPAKHHLFIFSDITNPSSKFSLTVWARGHGDQPTKRIGGKTYFFGCDNVMTQYS